MSVSADGKTKENARSALIRVTIAQEQVSITTHARVAWISISCNQMGNVYCSAPLGFMVIGLVRHAQSVQMNAFNAP